MFQWCSKGTLRVFKGSSKSFRFFCRFSKGVYRLFDGYFKDVSTVFQGISMVIRGCCKHVSKPFKVFYRNLHGCFKSVFSEFQECYEECSRAVFLGNFKSDSRKFLGF